MRPGPGWSGPGRNGPVSIGQPRVRIGQIRVTTGQVAGRVLISQMLGLVTRLQMMGLVTRLHGETFVFTQTTTFVTRGSQMIGFVTIETSETQMSTFSSSSTDWIGLAKLTVCPGSMPA